MRKKTAVSVDSWEDFVARTAETFQQQLDGVEVQLEGNSGSEFTTDETNGDNGDQSLRQYEMAMAHKRHQDLLFLCAELGAALDRIADGTYGVCLVCGEMIEQERLIAVPFTLYHVGHVPPGRVVNNGRRPRR